MVEPLLSVLGNGGWNHQIHSFNNIPERLLTPGDAGTVYPLLRKYAGNGA